MKRYFFPIRCNDMMACKDYYINNLGCEYLEDIMDDENKIIYTVLRPSHATHFHFLLVNNSKSAEELSTMLYITNYDDGFSRDMLGFLITGQITSDQLTISPLQEELDLVIPGTNQKIVYKEETAFLNKKKLPW